MSRAHKRLRIYTGRIYTPLQEGGWLDIPDGALVVNFQGFIKDIGSRSSVLKSYPTAELQELPSGLIAPGFVDCHQHLCHYPWVRLIANLQEWLPQIYGIESRFQDRAYANEVSSHFFTDLAANGTTTCCVHGPYFEDATDTAFAVASRSGLRVLMGMNAGDTNLPTPLKRTSGDSVLAAQRLFQKWQGKSQGLLSYVFTVRPAYCASPRLLKAVSAAAKKAGARIQSHLAEDAEGQNEILSLFPACRTEIEVYESCGLLTKNTIMAHGVYLSATDRRHLAATGTAVAHCPRANLLAGGRQMNYRGMVSAGVRVGLGTDLGGGKGLSMLRCMEDALKVTPFLSIHDVWRLATLDGAKALGVDAETGSLERAKSADFILLRPKRLGNASLAESPIEDILSSLVFRGDDRDVQAISVRGRQLGGTGLQPNL